MACVPFVAPPPNNGVQEEAALIPIIELAFKDGWWWPLSQEKSQTIMESKETSDVVPYDLDTRNYVLDFQTYTQRNIDNNRLRSFRVIWIREQDLNATHTGEIPAEYP